jgi:hypothetical protein
MKSERIRKSLCTGCGRALNGAANVGGDEAPRPGDATVCMYCGHVMAFDSRMRLRNLTDKEMIEVAGDKRIITIQRARAAAEKARQ